MSIFSHIDMEGPQRNSTVMTSQPAARQTIESKQNSTDFTA